SPALHPAAFGVASGWQPLPPGGRARHRDHQRPPARSRTSGTLPLRPLLPAERAVHRHSAAAPEAPRRPAPRRALPAQVLGGPRAAAPIAGHRRAPHARIVLLAGKCPRAGTLDRVRDPFRLSARDVPGAPHAPPHSARAAAPAAAGASRPRGGEGAV